ncbi:MAG: hypothetical protein KF900_11455 [Bacteroidetes bacterium]|nr:hypothetical protein [Bacteroidota bacterium]
MSLLLLLHKKAGAAPIFTVLKHFTAATDGALGREIIQSGTTIYGTSFNGGSENVGTLFSFDIIGNVFTVLKHFTTAEYGMFGSNKPIIKDSGTIIYVATSISSSGSTGRLFSFDTNGNVYTVLYSFSLLTGGAQKQIIKIGNIIYGVTQSGGTTSGGVLFSFNLTTTTHTTLKNFTAATDGSNFKIFVHTGGTMFYGITQAGGSNNVGTLFSFDISGNVFTVLRHFTAATDGSGGGPIIYAGGILYGATSTGGSNNVGTLFSYQP